MGRVGRTATVGYKGKTNYHHDLDTATQQGIHQALMQEDTRVHEDISYEPVRQGQRALGALKPLHQPWNRKNGRENLRMLMPAPRI